MPATNGYLKSTRSSGNDNCVEVKFLPDGRVSVRHSKDPTGPVLIFEPQAWNALRNIIHTRQFPCCADWDYAGSDTQARRTPCGHVELVLGGDQRDILTFTDGEWSAFCEGVRGGEFDWQPPASVSALARS